METRNAWLKNPEAGREIYHGDKILTLRDSAVSLRFDDGSVLDISANSDVRITQPSQKGVVAEEELGKREIRVMLGKVGYKSGENKNVKTRMVSPTAVAALRGTEVQFGTDGIYTLLNRIEGSSDNTGNISEGHVPDVTPEQAAKNQLYQAVFEASTAWEKYSAAKNSGASDANILLAKAVQKTDEALVLENKSLENHPDKVVKTRASEGLKSSQEALRKPLEALKSALDFQQKIEKNLERAQKDSQNQNAYQLIVRAATEAQEAVVNAVRAYMELAEVHTAELHGSDFERKIEVGIIGKIEIATEMAKNFEKKVEVLVEKAISSKDPNVSDVALKSAEVFVAAVALKSAEVFVAAAEANATVTELANKALDAEISGDKTESQKLNQTLMQIMETAGVISDKALQAEAVVEKAEKAAARNDSESLKEATEEVNAIQKEVAAELKTLPVVSPPATQPSQTTTPSGTAGQTGMAATPSSEPSLSTGGTSPSGGSETPLIQQSPPLQDINKATAPKPYGQ
ncbi:MAG: hypothetical protein HC887_08525 [Desulfobacteraceae bacterium]|nr:hypothetical protein [Desulfobacteraceae bacterium]